MDMHDEQSRRLLHLCRAAMPDVAGVVLSTLGGRALAHEEARVADPHDVAREASRTRAADTSALVTRGDAQYFVMFVPRAE